MRTQSRGITLNEIMIVVSIILVLSVVLWLTLGPKMKVKALESRITSDLRQITIAINIYKSDNNELLPMGVNYLPKNVPRGIGGEEDMGPLARNYSGPRDYLMIWNQHDAFDSDRLKCNIRWDEQQNGIVAAPFLTRATGAKTKFPLYDPKTWKVSSYIESPENVELQGFLDGHVKWRPCIELWLHELGMRRAFIGH